MRVMKDSGISWIDSIPNTWSVEPIKYNYNLVAGATPESTNAEFWDGDINWITPADFKTRDVYVSGGARNLSVDGYKSCSTSLLPIGSIVFSKRAPIGTVAITKTELCTNQGCLGLVEKHQKVWNKFYFYVLSIYGDVFNQYGAGTTFKEISANTFSNIKLPVPPIQEQKQIADFLDAKCAEINALTADIQTQIDTLEQYKRSVITEAVTKGLNPNAEMKDSGIQWIGNMPSSWCVLKGKYLFAQRSLCGNSIELQLLSPTQKFGVIPQALYEKLSGMNAVKLNEKADLSLLKTIHQGDFCISLRSFQGGFEYSEYEGVVSPAYQVFYPTVEIADGYYKYLFKEQGFIEKMNSYTMTLRDGKNIAFSDFGNTYIPYPPLQEQAEIAAYLNRKCDQTDILVAKKQQQLTMLDEYKKSLIFEYVTGKKEVPAS